MQTKTLSKKLYDGACFLNTTCEQNETYVTFIWPGAWWVWWPRRHWLTKAYGWGIVNGCWLCWHEMTSHAKKDILFWNILIHLTLWSNFHNSISKLLRLKRIKLTDVPTVVRVSSLNEPLKVIRELAPEPYVPSFLELLINQKILLVCSLIDVCLGWWYDLLNFRL